MGMLLKCSCESESEGWGRGPGILHLISSQEETLQSDRSGFASDSIINFI